MNFDDGILYAHNIEAYKRLVNAIEKKGKACAIHTTGTGKMYIALKWLLDNKNESFAYIAPTNVILDKFVDIIINQCFKDKKEELYDIANLDQRARKIEKLLGNKIHLLTYQGLSARRNANSHVNVNNIILDEFHHCGADIWGESINEFLKENEHAKILGLSATPLRNDGINMVNVLFDGIIDSEISLKEALATGILPIPIFIGAIYSFKEQLEKYENKLKNKRFSEETRKEIYKNIKEAKRTIEEAYGIREVFDFALSQLKNPNNAKFIVFCSDMDDKDKKMRECKNWFNKNQTIKMSSVDYSKSKKWNLKTIKKFEEDKAEGIKLLFAIDMIAEGLHIDDIDGVIMMRPTSSSLVFTQQLGRALSAGNQKNTTPIILDLVNNIEIIDRDLEDVKKIIKEYNGQIYGSDYFRNELSFSIQAKMLDIMSYLDGINYTFEEKIALLSDYYKKHGTIGNIKNRDIYDYNGTSVNIGILINELRKSYKLRFASKEQIQISRRSLLTNEQVKILEDLGMIWAPNDFSERIAPLVDYYNHNGTIDKIIYREEYEYKGEKINIGKLVSRLRIAYSLTKMSNEEFAEYKKTHTNTLKPLTIYEIEILEQLGMVWNKKHTFEEKIAPLIDYYKKHGTIGNIKSNEIYDYNGNFVNIGGLITNLKREYKYRSDKEKEKYALTNEEVNILENLGIIWEANNFSKRIAPLVDYYNKKKTINDIKKNDKYDYNGKIVKIGELILKLRTAYKAREEEIKTSLVPLTDEQVKILENLGITWNKKITFEERIAPLIDYYKKHGTISNIKYNEIYDYNGNSVNIGELISTLRKEYKYRVDKEKDRHALTDEQVKALESLGMLWSKKITFEERIAPLIDYYKKHGTIGNIKNRDIYDYNGTSVNIGILVSELRKSYKLRFADEEKMKLTNYSILTDEQVKILENIGMIWSKINKK